MALLAHPPQVVVWMLFLLWPLLVFWQLSSLTTSEPVRKIHHTPQGWRLTLSNGQVCFAELHGPVRVGRYLIVLCWQERSDLSVDDLRETPSQRAVARVWRVAIWADQLAADDWRRFSVALRWRRREDASGSKILSASVSLSSG